MFWVYWDTAWSVIPDLGSSPFCNGKGFSGNPWGNLSASGWWQSSGTTSTVAPSNWLLGEDDQSLFRRLAVFAGGFTLEAAEFIGAGDLAESGPALILDRIASLIDNSLLTYSDGVNGATRYRELAKVA